ncbi:hypothetical protein ZEAMMB73_Zm00001d012479 [Zea mays]|uniref:Uncharacterized protein n=1 Tax=Zea mays TaxID=4577 RepID=A0A1D6G907_MAIZE|nr:hypothetical protein ZEAMMB73_Zm00001d012479 [Zea mays]
MQRHDFVNQRCATLQRYLRRLAVVGHSPVLHASLTATGPNGIPTSDAQKRQAAGISNFASAVVRVNRSQAKLNAEILKHLATYSDHFASIWTKVAEETKGYAKSSS